MIFMRVPVLLTATIDTNDCTHVARASIDDRKSDYLVSLGRWLTETDFDLVLAENSGHDLDFLREVYADYSRRVEFISYEGNAYDRSLGKGYGEFDIIKKALNESRFIRSSDYFAKSTGRYFFPKMQSFVDGLSLTDYDYVGIFDQGTSNLVTTGFFLVGRKFITDFVEALPNRWPYNDNPVNDGSGFYIEELFTQLAHSTDRRLLIDKLGAEGISGTFGTPITWM